MIASQNSKERIEILKRITERNGFGEEAQVSFELVKKTKAEVIFKTGREKEINSKLTALRVLKFRIRWFKGVLEDMVIRFDDEIYDIRSIDHYQRADTFLVAERGKEGVID